MSKHTPGPWRWGKYAGAPALCEAITNNPIAVVDHAPSEANARLIAAAPDLLAAAQAALAVLTDLTTDEFARGADRPARDLLREAIAKSLGA